VCDDSACRSCCIAVCIGRAATDTEAAEASQNKGQDKSICRGRARNGASLMQLWCPATDLTTRGCSTGGRLFLTPKMLGTIASLSTKPIGVITVGPGTALATGASIIAIYCYFIMYVCVI
jgi:hypothetical protein